mmetsp:Transcript_125644/g.351873  ORF Transcript_125644/g.351873 Transcript_125644/m.351873 type:complete len:81 (+) Transcript_125644:201-443(+)
MTECNALLHSLDELGWIDVSDWSDEWVDVGVDQSKNVMLDKAGRIFSWRKYILKLLPLLIDALEFSHHLKDPRVVPWFSV